VFVNSVCGCAAGNARPALRLALQHAVRPQQVVTVFAGQDLEATSRARQYFAEYQPSSPSMALMRDGEVVHFVHRHQIEGRSPQSIAADLTSAFDRFCGAAVCGGGQEAWWVTFFIPVTTSCTASPSWSRLAEPGPTWAGSTARTSTGSICST
jgi:putative YphP/YqiW family bacilliredoxin